MRTAAFSAILTAFLLASFPSTTRCEAFPEAMATRLIAASVRLKVADATGNGYATGTIIARSGQQALVVTCGHVFRDSQGQGRIEVDTFGAQPQQGLIGELIGYDETSDVGLVAVAIAGEFEAAPLAPEDFSVADGSATASVGCDHGADPTARISQLNGKNKFVGPPNLQVAGQPVQGRSGGGLFTPDGYLIGVCNAADPQDDEGLYSAWNNVHAALKAHDVRLLYSERSAPRVAAETVSAPARQPALDRSGVPPLPPRPKSALIGVQPAAPPRLLPPATRSATPGARLPRWTEPSGG